MLSLTKKTVLLTLLFSLGCATVGVNKREYQSIQVLQRLDELQDVVIDLYNTNQLETKRAILYSKFIVSSTRVIQSAPNDWPTLVKTSWTELKKQIPLDKMEPKVKIAATLLDALLEQL